jgi:hypothetical protein
MLLHYSTHKVFNSHNQLFSNYEPSTVVSHLELTHKRASVSPINPWSDTREMFLPTVLQLLRHCWRGHVTLPLSCVIQVFIAVAWQQTRQGDARWCVTHHSTADLGSVQRKHRFVYCCIIMGACFDVTVLAWRKYATIYSRPEIYPCTSFLTQLLASSCLSMLCMMYSVISYLFSLPLF